MTLRLLLNLFATSRGIQLLIDSSSILLLKDGIVEALLANVDDIRRMAVSVCLNLSLVLTKVQISALVEETVMEWVPALIMLFKYEDMDLAGIYSKYSLLFVPRKLIFLVYQLLCCIWIFIHNETLGSSARELANVLSMDEIINLRLKEVKPNQVSDKSEYYFKWREFALELFSDLKSNQ
jgi:hypothetical protein